MAEFCVEAGEEGLFIEVGLDAFQLLQPIIHLMDEESVENPMFLPLVWRWVWLHRDRPFLPSRSLYIKENAVTTLFNLSLEDSNRAAIAGAEAVKPLVYTLRTGIAVAKQNATCAILRLSIAEENRAGIGMSGAIPTLVVLLHGGTVAKRGGGIAEKAVVVLRNLAEGTEAIVEEGGIGSLVEVVEEESARGKFIFFKKKSYRRFKASARSRPADA